MVPGAKDIIAIFQGEIYAFYQFAIICIRSSEYDFFRKAKATHRLLNALCNGPFQTFGALAITGKAAGHNDWEFSAPTDLISFVCSTGEFFITGRAIFISHIFIKRGINNNTRPASINIV